MLEDRAPQGQNEAGGGAPDGARLTGVVQQNLLAENRAGQQLMLIQLQHGGLHRNPSGVEHPQTRVSVVRHHRGFVGGIDLGLESRRREHSLRVGNQLKRVRPAKKLVDFVGRGNGRGRCVSLRLPTLEPTSDASDFFAQPRIG